jgi:hypothetical protein
MACQLGSGKLSGPACDGDVRVFRVVRLEGSKNKWKGGALAGAEQRKALFVRAYLVI